MSADRVRETAPTADAADIQIPDAVGPEPRKDPAGGSRNKGGRPPGGGTSATTPPPRGAGRPTVRDTETTARARAVADTYRVLASGCHMAAPLLGVRYRIAGMVIESEADNLGIAWARWAASTPWVAKMLDRAAFGGGMFAVVLAHGPIVTALMSMPGGLDDLPPEQQEMAVGMFASLQQFMQQATAPDGTPPAA